MAFWRKYLKEAPLPAFPSRPDRTANSTPSALLRSKIVLPRKRIPTVPIETIIQTAWALVNIYYSDTDDVVYGLAVIDESWDNEEHETHIQTLTSYPARFIFQPAQTISSCLESMESQTREIQRMSRDISLEEIASLSPDAHNATKFDNQLVIFTDMMSTLDVKLDRAVNVECTFNQQGITAHAFYNPSIIDTIQMQRVLGTFESLVHQLSDANNMPRSLEDLNSISSEDLAQATKWNTSIPPAVEACMHHLISERARDNPRAEAVCGLGVSFTYEELDVMTDNLAHALRSKGIGPGKMVPYMFEKSTWTVVAMLASLKAGGAFVPLDPAHKWKDTAGILESCNATFVLCSEMHAQRFKDHSVEATTISQSFVSSLPSLGPASFPVQPSDPGYIIFTSGSTGKPKGIICSHRAWCTNAMSHGVAELNGPLTRLLQFSAYTFDISISDIFTTLAFGGCVCVPTEEERMNDLSGAINRMQVTQLAATPTVAQFLKPDEVPTLEVLICGGESMSMGFLDSWAHRVKLMNSYGPAECTSRISCAWKSAGDDGAGIGRAIGGVTWVAQSNNPHRLVPIGAVGELLVEGHILADGYLDDKPKTREAFIDKPKWLKEAFPDRADGRVYRTGDLVQYCSDGQLKFLGRRDTQIKIHGVRLECGHIEAKIAAELPGDASVIVEKIYAGEKQLLAAFLTLPHLSKPSNLETELSVNTDQIRSFIVGLQQKLLADLPSYMVPHVFLPVTAIPLGATGKVSRKALQALVKEIPEEDLMQFTAVLSVDGEKPTTQMEIVLCSLVTRVLNLSQTSIMRQDNFFNLGGDSVSAMKLVSAANEANITISVADIFKFPKVADLAAHLESGSATAAPALTPIDNFELIGGATWFQGIRQYLSKEYKLSARRVEDIYPCTPMQEGMMAETIVSPEAYILQEVLRLSPNVNINELKDAWEELAAAYPIMRTRIVTLPHLGTCQLVISEEPLAWAESGDLTTYLREDKENHMGYGDVLSRFAIIQENGGHRFLVWTCHHAITDGHMHQDILRRVTEAYNGRGLELTTDFNQFIKYLKAQNVEESKTYWQSQFTDLTDSNFPVFDDLYEPSVTDYINLTMALPSASSVTSSILIRAAWAFVLSQLTANGDVVLGITQSGRDIELSGIGGCLGPVLATVPVRVNVRDMSVSCVQYLAKVQEQYVTMIPHQHTGLQHIRKISAEAAEACNFHNLLVVQPAAAVEMSKLFQPTESRNSGDQLNFGLLLECILNVDSTVTVRAGFDKNIMTSSETEQLLHRLQHVISQLGSPESASMPLSKLSITSPRDVALLQGFNPDKPALEECMHWLVEKQARLRPDAIAVDGWDAQLTFAQLLDYSDRLAGKLVELGVGPEVIVPFAFEKSAWATVGMHAILRAGGACVALDMAHPRRRHEQIVADTEARVIVASAKQAYNIDLVPHVVVVSRQELDSLPPRPRATNTTTGVSPSNAAFVVYSSGSTGTPKGSILEHRSLCSTSRTNSEILGVGPTTRAIHFASYSFDVAIEENIIIPMYGGTVCIPGDEERLNDLPGAMRRMAVNWADLTPTVGRLLTPENVPCLRTLVLGGEALTKDIIDTWAGKVDLFNTYGPSECSIQCTSSKSLVQAAAGANIGRAVNCKLWVVDAEDPDRLLPPGSVGELLIEGPIVGRGYLKEPVKTKAAFISGLSWAASTSLLPSPSPLSPRRFYRTGDLARFNPDGTLDCLGRRDTQIKLHGQRIELGEIEYHIKKASLNPETTTVAVEAFAPKGSSRKLLAAFVQPRDANSPDVVLAPFTDALRIVLEQLREKARRDLPDYMLPSLFVPVSSLPMNTSGKIDRKKLREAASAFEQNQLAMYSLAQTAGEKRSLGSPLEETLARLWAEVLHIDVVENPIGADDSFLELGGDSITAMQLVGKARSAGIILSVPIIMKNAKLAAIASAAKAVESEVEKAVLPEDKATPATVYLKPYTPFSLLSTTDSLQTILSDLSHKHSVPTDLIEDIYPCTALQAGLMAITAVDPSAYIVRNVYRLPDSVDIRLFKAAWAAVVRKTPILRTRVVFVDGVGSCQLVLDERLAWRTADTVKAYLDSDKASPMNYGTALSRWAIVTEPTGVAKFVWSIHHALYDGFSFGLTLAAVDYAYHNAMAVPTSTPFIDYIRFTASTDREAETAFWTRQLADLNASTFPAVPIGKQCAADNTVEYRFKLNRKRAGFTTATLLKAAWAITVSALSNAEDVVFGVTQFGRDVALGGVEDMNGPTITTVPLRFKVDQNATVDNFLTGAQNQSIDMIPFSHTGLQNIKKMSDAAKDACSFQNLLVIQPEADEDNPQSVFRNHETATTGDRLEGFGLVIECALGTGTVSISAHYDSSVIMGALVERLLHQFEQVILELCGNAHTVRDIEMFSENDRKDVMTWNSNQPIDINRCAHHIISEQAQLTPTAPAIETREASISYKDLEDLTSDLAHRLQSLGVGPDTIIPICLEKSYNGILAMVGIQKAGGAFVSLNPTDPHERLAGLIEQVNAPAVIFSEQTAYLIPNIAADKKTIIMPASLKTWGPLNTAPILSTVQPHNLAYALFTSGSTGKPKAVELPHRSVSSSVMGHAIAMGYLPGRARRVLQFTSYTFDPCIIEIFTTLTHGGCICVPAENERMNSLTKFVTDFQCDYVIFTPSLVRALNPDDMPTVKTVVLGGEPMTREIMEIWGDRVHLINAYGPTETTIVCTSRTVCGPKTVADSDRRHRPENIGRPVNSMNWVVDPVDYNRLVPVGCIGELAVTGPILAKGYLNNEEKTNEVFVQDASWLHKFGLARQRLYRTGDLVRQDPADGSLVYVARKDNQTKVNGQRLELGEIEIQLKTKGTGVGNVVVLAEKTTLDTKKQTLAAFIEFTDSIKTGPTTLHIDDLLRGKLQKLEDTMRATLPRYMVPSLWIPVSKMPSLAASGKTDRKTLAGLLKGLDAAQLALYGLVDSAPQTDLSGDAATDMEATDMETTILSLVARHLGRDASTIYPDNSFVRLGGDSITAIQLVSAARAKGIILSTEDILSQPKLRDIARNAKKSNGNTKAKVAAVEPYSMLKDKEEILKNIDEEYGIPASVISDVLPCTPLQEGLIALTVKDPEAYVLRETYRLPSKLDLNRFKAAWAVVAQDVCLLRTRIVNLEGHGCLQIVMENNSEWQSAKSVKEYVEIDNQSPFKYGVPLCKLGIVETPYSGTYFMFTIHHSLYDGWSKGLIMQKVAEAYESATPQPTISLTPPFNRFIQYLQGVDYNDSRKFWKDQFDGLEAQAFPRTPSASFDAVLDKKYHLDVPLARKLGSAFTTSTILKAAWAIVLCRYTGTSDALFGFIQTGRNAPIEGISDIIGPTLTTVPLRIKLDTQTTMTSFLQNIQDQTNKMTRYEQTGLQNIARMSPECRDACAFSSIMVIQPGNQGDVDFLGAHQVHDQDKDLLRFGLGLECTLRDDCVQVTGAYDQRLIAESQMQRILHQFQAAAQQINLETQDSVFDIDLFSSEDWHEITQMNKNVPNDVSEVTHEVIHRVALELSDSVAVNAWDIDLSYRELDYLSSVLAHHLRSLGVGPETIVPLCFEKSGWAVVAVLGVIKAGGAFVFLDPSYPIARLTEIVNQVEAKVLLSSLATSSLWESSGPHVQIVDNVAIELLPSVAGMPETNTTPNSALYVIFTSGSTGKPKGCVIEHHSFLACAGAQAARANITTSSRILQGASYSFDVSVMEMLTALTVGACICVPNERAKNRSVTEVINDFGITWAFLTPSVAKFMKPADVPCLKTLVLGGEALTTQNIKTWADEVQLINGYGPSECTIAASANSNLTLDTDPANIGKALGGICWIVDPEDHNKLAPMGTIGELLIEGPIVARGYLNNPEKTAEVFIEDPAWAERKDGNIRRLYKTGDLAYFSTEGNIMFVGRKDTQVKVRGQRMELGEIETHLSLNKEIQHAMVMYPKVGQCKQRLVGLISLKSFGATTNSTGTIDLLDSSQLSKASKYLAEITAELSSIVPGYMVPSMWIILGSFPLLVSGKLNRKRVEHWLNNIDEATYHRICGIGEANSVQAPQNTVEAELRGIWAEVLKLPTEEIGTTLDFTSLGGDSILAMVVIAKLRKKGSNISMIDMMKARNIVKLAALIQQGPATTNFTAQPEVEETADEVFDLTPIQQYYANFTLKQVNYLSKQTNKRFNHTFCLRVKNNMSAKDLSKALESLVDRHSMLRARFVRDDVAPCGWRQYVSTNAAECYQFRAWDDYTLDQIRPLIEEARISLDLENGPIMAADLVTVDANNQYFYIVAHHLVVDLVSWNSILLDLEDFLLHGDFIADKPYPFTAWAKLQREHAVANLPPRIAYPLKVPDADFAYWGMDNRINIVRDASFRSFVLTETHTSALLQKCSQQYSAEPMDILCSALSHSFSFVFRDRNTPTIFRYGHGREAAAIPGGEGADVSSTVGWFTTLSPLHVRVRSGDDSLTVLHRTVDTRKKIPGNGFDYFASRHHHPEGLDPAGPFAKHDQMEITINYLGVSDGQQRNRMRLFEMPQNMEGSLGGQDQEVKCFSLFYVSAEVQNGRMHLSCMWNKRASGQEKIGIWFGEYEKCLVDIARRAAAGQVPRRRVIPAYVARRKYGMS